MMEEAQRQLWRPSTMFPHAIEGGCSTATTTELTHDPDPEAALAGLMKAMAGEGRVHELGAGDASPAQFQTGVCRCCKRIMPNGVGLSASSIRRSLDGARAKEPLRFMKFQLRVREMGGQQGSQPRLPGQPRPLAAAKSTSRPCTFRCRQQ